MSELSSSEPPAKRKEEKQLVEKIESKVKMRRKRGTACEHCRIRKLRCTGVRPSCSECAKTHRKCVYRISKPEDEILALEARVADLERMLEEKATSSSGGPSFSAQAESSPMAQAAWTTIQTEEGAVPSTWDAQEPLLAPEPDWATLASEIDLDLLLGCSQTSSLDPTFDFSLDFIEPSSSSASPFSTLNVNPQPPALNSVDPSSQIVSLEGRARDQAVVFEEILRQSRRLHAVEIKDVAPVVRDHLLDLFATRPRQLALNLIGPRFRESLIDPCCRSPHPALFFAICTTSCRLSPISAVRSLEECFLAVTRLKVAEGIAKFDQLVQLIQASVILGLYFTSTSRQSEAWSQAAISTRLAVNAGLHRQRPVVVEPDEPALPHDGPFRTSSLNIFKSLKRCRAIFLPPPKDSYELGERISTFWATYWCDRWSALVMGWPPVLSQKEITVPFPKEQQKFEEGNPYDDDVWVQSVADLWAPIPPHGLVQLQNDCLPTLIFKAISLAGKAARLFEVLGKDVDESGSTPNSESLDNGSPTTTTEFGAVAFPTELVLMRAALERFVYNLPVAYQEPLHFVQGGIPKLGLADGRGLDAGAIVLHSVIYAAYQLVCDEEANFNASLQAGSLVAARCVAVLIRRINDIDFGQLDLHLAAVWTLTSRTLLREITRLRKAGADASALEDDVGVIHLASRRLGASHRYGTTQADLIAGLAGVSLGN